jgi:hypothetical protein
MPTISRFFGIVIRMYVKDHSPPHFHAIYGDDEAQIAIETGDVIEGALPPTARRFVREWTNSNRERLADNWRRRELGLPLEWIDGLDAE